MASATNECFHRSSNAAAIAEAATAAAVATIIGGTGSSALDLPQVAAIAAAVVLDGIEIVLVNGAPT